jgi:gliding motility-associated-like protein
MKTQIKVYLFLFVFFWNAFLNAAFAGTTHITGGDLTYNCLGTDPDGDYIFELALNLYRECTPHVPPIVFDEEVTFSIFNPTDGTLVTQVTFARGDIVILPNSQYDECYTIPDELCYEATAFRGTVTLPPSESGYIVNWGRCCRDVVVVNIDQPTETGFLFQAEIPNTSLCNSSPSFNQEIPLVVCTDRTQLIDLSAFDADGDSLTYEWADSYAAGNSDDNYPENVTPPYETIQWAESYSTAFQIAADPAFILDTHTGIIRGKPSQEGEYVFAIKVNEYRDGVLISETYRDGMFIVLNCQLSPEPEITRKADPQLVGDTLIFYPGETTCFGFEIMDPTPAEDKRTWAEGEIFGDGSMPPPFATYPDTTFSTASAEVYLCWNPGCDFEGPSLSKIYIYAEDENDCPGPNRVIDSLFVKVVPGNTAIALTANCARIISPTQVEVSWNSLNSNMSDGFDAYLVYEQISSQWVQVGEVVSPDMGSFEIDYPSSVIDQVKCFAVSVRKNCMETFESEPSNEVCTNDTCSGFLNVPNVFTPNNDGVNDAILLNVNSVESVRFNVYDRWGALTFSSNQIPIEWKGFNTNGIEASEGVYFYVLTYITQSGVQVEQKGTISLFR